MLTNTKIKSKYRVLAYVLLILLIGNSLLLPGIFLGLIDSFQTHADFRTKMSFSFGFIYFVFIELYLLFVMFKTKIISISLKGEVMIVRRYMGFGKKQKYTINEFDGYSTAIMRTRSSENGYEYLFLWKNGKREIKISEQFHSNFLEIKDDLTKSVNFIGYSSMGYYEEVKDIFK